MNGNTVVTFTAEPEDGWMVGSWIVDGKTIDSQENEYQITVTSDIAVSVNLIPDTYTITAEKTGKGILAVDEKQEESYQAGYGSDMTFTAEPEDYWTVKEWKVDGETVTEGVSADKTTFTLSNIKQNRKVEVVFTSALLYDLSYSVVQEKGGKLNVVADGTPVTLGTGQSTSIPGGSKLEFTAVPDNGWMVKEWTVNGEVIEGNLSTSLVIEKMTKAVNVTVEYVPYKGYIIPTDGKGYLITEVGRTPDDTTPKTEIRENGDLTFTFALDTENGYNTLSKLVINGYDCIADTVENDQISNCDKLISKQNEDGSYTITIKNVTGEILLDADAHKLEKVEAKEATCIKEGNIEYWMCQEDEMDCSNSSRKFKDKDGKEPLAEGEEIIPADKENGHSFDNPIFTWNGTSSAVATFTCDLCREEKEVSCTISSKQVVEEITYTATAELNGKTWTDIKKETIPHKYGAPTFTWNGTSSATASFTCSQCKDVQKVTCTISSKQEGEKITYTAAAVFEGKTWTDTKTETIPHKYGTPAFTWNGTSSATASFTCSQCGDVKKAECTITSKQEGDNITYTATATFEGKTWTDTKTETIPHKYGAPTFTWNGTSSATALFTCVNCGETKTVNCKVTSKSGKDTVTYTATVTLEGKTYKDVQTVDVKMSNVEFKLQGRTSKNAIRLTWQRVPAVKGYDIFRAQCNGKKLKLIKTIKGNSKRTWTDTKKKANSQYKYYVKAYKLVNGKKKYVNQSNMIHIALPSRYTNVKTVKAASKLSLKKGKQKKLSVKLSYERKGKKLVKHMNYLSYKTTNKKVATVTSKGVIRARSKGSCYVYITAASGAYTRVKVTVK